MCLRSHSWHETEQGFGPRCLGPESVPLTRTFPQADPGPGQLSRAPALTLVGFGEREAEREEFGPTSNMLPAPLAQLHIP